MIGFWAVALAGLAVLALSHAGRWHPLGDSMAVGRPALALAGLLWLSGGVLAGLAHPLWIAAPALSAATVLLPLLRHGGRGRGFFTLYQKNLSFGLGDPAALMADIRAVDPDVITLQEVSTLNEPVLEALSDRWPHRHLCPHDPVGGLAVLSRHAPTGAQPRFCAVSAAGLRIAGPGGPVWVVSLHLPWPWPFGQALYVDAACTALEALEGPVLLAGDCNMVPWSDVLRRLERATGSRRAGRALGSFRLGPVRLPIDHALAPRPGRTERRPLCGSDHHGLVVRIQA